MSPKKKRVVKRKVKIEMTEEYEDGGSEMEYVEVEQRGNENKVKSIDELGKIAKRKLLNKGDRNDRR